MYEIKLVLGSARKINVLRTIGRQQQRSADFEPRHETLKHVGQIGLGVRQWVAGSAVSDETLNMRQVRLSH